MIVTFTGTFSKRDCRQDGYTLKTSRRGRHKILPQLARCVRYHPRGNALRFVSWDVYWEFPPFTMRIGTHVSLTGCCVARVSTNFLRMFQVYPYNVDDGSSWSVPLDDLQA